VARRAAELGLRVPTVEVDFPAVLDRARSILMRSRHGIENGFLDSDNPTCFRAHARLVGRQGDLFRAAVGDDSILARQVVLDTGTRSEIPEIPGLADVDYLDAGNWIDRPELPEHLVFLGGGTVAMEMAQLYRRLGSRVTLVEKGDRFLRAEDDDVSGAMQRLLEAEEILFHPRCVTKRVLVQKGGVALSVESDGERFEIAGTQLFVATGRRPNTDDLGLESVGLVLAEDGAVPVDERLATSVPGLWAAGDIRGGPMFTHTAWDDYRILDSQLLGDGSRTTRRVVPYAVFTDPELGRVGETERAARTRGADVLVSRFELSENSKAREIGETDGFVKVVADAKSGRFLGAAVLAHEGAELVHLFVDLMNADAPFRVMKDAVHIHPTLAEAVQSAVAALDRGSETRQDRARAESTAEPVRAR
jgi:pyruvate/2-oxoglutarate dehydrogenase complex dihydrolipoamide dehydrogenase (E3) component